jgi:hypothetical protein
VFGESLGSFNTLYREFTDDRDPGSREVEPVYNDGLTVRLTQRPRGGWWTLISPSRGDVAGPEFLWDGDHP